MATNSPMPKPPSGLHPVADTETVILELGPDYQPKAGPPVKK
jgi:hypothetical protein